MKDHTRPFLAVVAVLALMSAGMVMIVPADDSSATIMTGTAGKNITWSFDSSSEVLTFSGTGEMYDYSNNPEENPFGDLQYPISTVIINSGITYIGENLLWFGGNSRSITSVSISNTVTEIGEGAFASCGLTSITIPSSVTHIRASAFADNPDLASITLSEGLKSIAGDAFYNTGITSVSIPASVTSISGSAFSKSQLSEVTVNGSSVSYCSVDNVLFSKDKTTLVMYPSKKTNTEYTVPTNTTTIGEGAFRYADNIQSINLPNTIERIEKSAFFSTKLATINIPSSVSYIGNSAFSSTKLATINIPSSVSYIGSYAFSSTDLTEISIGAAEVGPSAFIYCKSLESVTFNGVISIGNSAFKGCTSLAEITVPLADLNNEIFAECTNLTSVLFEDGVTKIPQGIFRNTSLTTVTIPLSVTTIQSYAFYGTNLETAYVPNTTHISTDSFPTTTNVIRYDPPVEITSTQDDVSIITGTNFSYNIATAPADATISVTGATWLNVSGHLIYGTVSESGEYTITVSAYKDGYDVGSQSFTVTVLSELVFISGPSAGYIVQAGGQ